MQVRTSISSFNLKDSSKEDLEFACVGMHGPVCVPVCVDVFPHEIIHRCKLDIVFYLFPHFFETGLLLNLGLTERLARKPPSNPPGYTYPQPLDSSTGATNMCLCAWLLLAFFHSFMSFKTKWVILHILVFSLRTLKTSFPIGTAFTVFSIFLTSVLLLFYCCCSTQNIF